MVSLVTASAFVPTKADAYGAKASSRVVIKSSHQVVIKI